MWEVMEIVQTQLVELMHPDGTVRSVILLALACLGVVGLVLMGASAALNLMGL